jgi:hypothetical protein
MKRQVDYIWRLAEIMAAHGMHNSTDLIPRLAERGIQLSRPQGARRAGSGAHQLSAERARLESIAHAAYEYADHDLCSRFDDFMA